MREQAGRRAVGEREEDAPINDAYALTPARAFTILFIIYAKLCAEPVHGYHRLASGHGLPYVCRYRHRPAYLYQLRVVPAARIIM